MPIQKVYYFGVALIGVALFIIRMLSNEFALGTTTADHPYLIFTGVLIFANCVALFLIYLIQKLVRADINLDAVLWTSLALGLGFRAMFFGSTPIYEDDWNRYLWDGAVFAEGLNPYPHSPETILQNSQSSELESYRDLSNLDEGETLARINNAHLGTIYPPIAIGFFSLASFIKPFDLDALRGVYLIVEALTLFLLVKTLSQYGRSPLWAALYALHPLLIFSAFNVAHMDILLSPFILVVLMTIKTRPYLAALAMVGAAGIKLWPLLLAPVVYRQWRNRPIIYMTAAGLIAALSFLMVWPMLTVPENTSGLQAYSGQWQRSSFLFPIFENWISNFSNNAGYVTRIMVAIIVTAISLFYGFMKPIRVRSLPKHLLIVTLALLILSPTGFPWYLIWVLIFMPFVPSYGLALLAALVPLYYVRFALGEQGVYHIYTDILVPVQFGLPLLLIAFDFYRMRDRDFNYASSDH